MAHLNRVAVWERPDGGISVTYFDFDDMIKHGFVTLEEPNFTTEKEDAFIVWYVNRLKPSFGNITPTIIKKSEVPMDRSERGEWSLKNGKVEIDPVKVQIKAQIKVEKQAIFLKMGITEDEFRKINRRA